MSERRIASFIRGVEDDLRDLRMAVEDGVPLDDLLAYWSDAESSMDHLRRRIDRGTSKGDQDD